MGSILAGFIYGCGVTIISESAHLKWWTGFGIWLTGIGLALIIIMVLTEEGR